MIPLFNENGNIDWFMEQAGAELGQSQLQLERGFTCLLAYLLSFKPAYIEYQTFLQ